MISRLRNMLKTVIRKFSFIMNRTRFAFSKDHVECNICNYRAVRFISDDWHSYIICPNCGSDIRQRLLWAMLVFHERFNLKKLIEGKRILHFAPEKKLGELLKKHAELYKTADLMAKGYHYGRIDFNIDISNMPVIEEMAFDCVIACDVLEHVANHTQGIKEVYRILKRGGCCIFTVPQRDALEKTYEDLSIIDPVQREKAFGQSDHLRIYGEDFLSMLKDAGFHTEVINASFFAEETVKKNVLFPPVLSKKENATNFRNIFVGVK